jgi:adenylyl cyclase-associated protein
MKDLAKYIKKNHTPGLTWNPKGGEAKPGAGAAAAPSAGGPPPPPSGGPPAPPAGAPAPSKAAAAADPSALFAALNKGTAITGGLKKVTNDMKTKYRDPSEKVSVVKAADVKVSADTNKPIAKKMGAPKFALEGNKWVVENQVDNKNIQITDTEFKHAIYVYGCVNSVIVVKGKVNSLCLDLCKKTGIVFDDAVSTCDVVNCTSVDIQCLGKCPSFTVDKTAGYNLFLSKNGLDAEIVSAKSDTMNISIPGATANDDLVELAVPEQYKTVIKGNRLVTEAVQHV